MIQWMETKQKVMFVYKDGEVSFRENGQFKRRVQF